MSSPPILLTTTGTLSIVPIADLGRIPGFIHPVTDFDMVGEFRLFDLVFSDDLQDAVDNGYITLKDQYGLPITNVSAQVHTSLGILNEGIPIADYASELDFYGASLVTGASGCVQVVGLQGDDGPQGNIGGEGPQGSQGVIGPQGLQGTAAGSESFLLNGTFNGTTNNDKYLNGPDGVSLELAPLVMPFDAELTAMSATSEQGAGTAVWDAELYVNGVLKTGASLFLDDVDKVYQDGFPGVTGVEAGDELALFVDRTSGGIRKPRINAFFRRTE
jgi:hypothetical protein